MLFEMQIRELSYYAQNLLESFSAGTVHSVYRRTINLTDGKQLAALQAADSPLSPVSLISTLDQDGMKQLAVRPGDAVIFQNNGLEIKSAGHSYRFTYADARRQNTALSKTLNPEELCRLCAQIKRVLPRTAAGGFAALFQEPTQEHLSLVLEATKKRVARSRGLHKNKNYPESAAEAAGLIGLGTGLTPSGDDFLCGVLAGLSLRGRWDHPFAQCLKSEISSRLFDTVDISASFLKCALNQQFSMPVCSLQLVPDSDTLQSAFEAVGHSSGMDTLCGVYWALACI